MATSTSFSVSPSPLASVQSTKRWLIHLRIRQRVNTNENWDSLFFRFECLESIHARHVDQTTGWAVAAERSGASHTASQATLLRPRANPGAIGTFAFGEASSHSL